MPTKTIAIINHKGGVGKTTASVNLGGYFAKTGKKVLLMDFDPQANLTTALLAPESFDAIAENDFLYNTLIKGDPLKYREIEKNLSLALGSIKLADAEVDLISKMAREIKLKKALSKENSFEYLIIDCPPALNQLTINALVASDYVLIPLKADYFSLTALKSIVHIYNIVRDDFNENLKILGLFANDYNDRINLDKNVKEEVKAEFGNTLLKSSIRKNIALSESITPPYCTHIFNYAPKSNGAQDYENLALEIIERLNLNS